MRFTCCSDWRKSIEALSLQKLSRAEDIKVNTFSFLFNNHYLLSQEKRFEASYELSLYNDSRISRTLENFARISDLHVYISISILEKSNFFNLYLVQSRKRDP